ncbi:hypothetical protein JCM5350_001767 [Sporobolomyces pararoseus]
MMILDEEQYLVKEALQLRLGKAFKRTGYKPDHEAQSLLASVVSTFDPDSSEGAVPLDARIAASKSLHDVIAIFSTRASLPIQNLNLPHDILSLIFDQILDLEDPLVRRKTMHSLALTSIAWSKIAFPRCTSDVFIGTVREAKEWSEYSRRKKTFSRQSRQLDSLRIKWGLEESETLDTETKLLKEFFGGGMRPKHVSVEVPRFESIGNSHWYKIIEQLVRDVENFSLTIPVETLEENRAALCTFVPGRPQSLDSRRELTFEGSPEFIPLFVVKSIFNDDLTSFLDRDGPTNGNFLLYNKLSTPFLAFTVPVFLLEQPDQPLPPSRLEHLEITLEFDPDDEQVPEELKRFFQVISPRIKHLALRIRVLAPDDEFEIPFTEDLMDGITSCKRLRHFEIGGFGFKFDTLISRLSVLPLESLHLHPMSPSPSLEHFLGVFDTPSTLRSHLRLVSRALDAYRWRVGVDPWAAELKSSGIKELCFKTVNGEDEDKVLQEALQEVGMMDFSEEEDFDSDSFSGFSDDWDGGRLRALVGDF